MRTPLDELAREDLTRILTEPRNAIVKQFQASLGIDKAELLFEDDAIVAIAELAIKQNTGARGLRAIVEKMMIDLMFEIPSIGGKKRVVITRDVVTRSIKPEIRLVDQKSA